MSTAHFWQGSVAEDCFRYIPNMKDSKVSRTSEINWTPKRDIS